MPQARNRAGAEEDARHPTAAGTYAAGTLSIESSGFGSIALLRLTVALVRSTVRPMDAGDPSHGDSMDDRLVVIEQFHRRREAEAVESFLEGALFS